jgi:hypothetical protein
MYTIMKEFKNYLCWNKSTEPNLKFDEIQESKIKKYIMLNNNKNKRIFCSYTKNKTSTLGLEDMLYDFLKLDRNNYEIIITHNCDGNNINKYKYINEIFESVKHNKKNKIPFIHRDVFLSLTYEIKENYYKTHKKIIDSIEKKYANEIKHEINIHVLGLSAFQLNITPSFTLEEIKVVIYLEHNIEPDCQQLSQINKTNYKLKTTSEFVPEMLSSSACFNFNHDKIKSVKIDINLDTYYDYVKLNII